MKRTAETPRGAAGATDLLPRDGLHARAPGAAGERYQLLIFDGEQVTTFPLPASGELAIGRGEESAIRIDVQSISRRHALLRIGERVELVELGSANGTRLRGKALAANTAVILEPGDALELGGVTAVLQHWRPGGTALRPRRIVNHETFEELLEDACLRGEAGGAAPAVVRLRLADAAQISALEALLADHLERGERAGSYAPGEVELLLEGAPDVLEKRVQHLLARLSRAKVEARSGLAIHGRDGKSPELLLARAAPPSPAAPSPGAVVIQDPEMQRLHALVARVAVGTIAVLVLGETGSGKEVIAEAVHRASPRAARPYVRINCASLSETLLESELFGHEKGAFTGAVAAKPGLLETAEGGTVLLDEVGELPPALQAKLLRVLEQREVQRVGALRPRPLDVRFVSATNRDLEDEIRAGRFRQDLFFRLNGVSLRVPPLRERPGEIEDLALTFLQQAARALGRRPPRLEPAALELLRAYRWPGNIRELRNVLERAVLLADDAIGPEHLPQERLQASFVGDAPVAASSSGEGERERLLRALGESGGNQTDAAKQLGISSRTLRAWLDRHGIARPRARK